MIYRNVNFCGRTIELADGDVLEGCNLAQREPHTAVAQGVSGLTFIHCNCTNCDLPKDAMIFPPHTPLHIRRFVNADGMEETEVVA